ncbi:MAG TPA: hypothetical protein VG869_08815 [Acidimicrobiia bacterium]|nr:hypothetical protein [Acidimicrobiia bacterium]
MDRRDAIAVGILLAAFALPLRGLLRSPGPPMEEGFMLVFPDRVLAGAIPNKDFLYLYGPGSLWALAGVFRVFGTSIFAERAVGLLQQLAVVFGVFALARRWGREVALGCGLTSLLFLVPSIGLTALAWAGGVGLALLALVAAAGSRDAAEVRHAQRLALVAGLLAGFALLYRIDLVVAIGLAILALGWGASRSVVRRFGIGLALGLSPYVAHLATAGPGTVVRGMITEPLFKLRGGRRLPIPPSWSHLDGTLEALGSLVALRWPLPMLPSAAQLTVWFFLLPLSVVVLAAAGIQAVRRDRASVRARVLLAMAGFSAGILPQAIQRADSAHLDWVSCVTIAFLPVAGLELVTARWPRWPRRTLGIAASAAVLAVLAFVISTFTVRSYADYAVQSFGNHRAAGVVTNRGRSWYTAFPKPAVELLAATERASKPGQRLLVGPTDLRKTPYSEAFFYYLLPQLTPATRYVEMDPGVANAKHSGLADEVRRSDVLILSDQWVGWNEPNDSRRFGPNEPNVVVQDQFCLVGTFGPHPHYSLYVRCRR